MSAKLMGMVYDLVLSPSEREILMALADHAQHDGTGCHPSVALLAWKTDRSERCIQYTLRKLEEKKLILPAAFSAGGRGMATEYHLHLENGQLKPPFQKGAKIAPIEEKGAKSSTKRVQNDAQKGATVIAPQPLYNHPLEPKEPPLLSPRELHDEKMGGDAGASKDDELHATFVALMAREPRQHEQEKWSGAVALAHEKHLTPAMLREAWRRALDGPRKFSSADYVRPWSLLKNWQRWEMGPVTSGLAQVTIHHTDAPSAPPPPPEREPTPEEIARADAARAEIAAMFAGGQQSRKQQEQWRHEQGIWTAGHRAHCPCTTCGINRNKSRRKQGQTPEQQTAVQCQ